MTGAQSAPTVLVMAKAPVPGLAKTRLAATVGDVAAAEVAAAALLDTLDVAVGCTARCVVALTGDLDEACRADELRAALARVTVVPQRGGAFDERLAAAHADAGPGPVVQIGTDTPQLTPQHLDAVASGLQRDDAVLGPAEDGGWWVLALRDPAHADALRGVEMSAPTTHDETRAALRDRGLSVASAPAMRDVDTAEDAGRVALLAPHTRFATAWRALELEASR